MSTSASSSLVSSSTKTTEGQQATKEPLKISPSSFNYSLSKPWFPLTEKSNGSGRGMKKRAQDRLINSTLTTEWDLLPTDNNNQTEWNIQQRR